MKMPDACAIQADRVYRVAAAEEVMSGVQAETEQVRVDTLAQSLDLFRRFDESAGMMMEDRGQSQFAASLRDASKDTTS